MVTRTQQLYLGLEDVLYRYEVESTSDGLKIRKDKYKVIELYRNSVRLNNNKLIDIYKPGSWAHPDKEKAFQLFVERIHSQFIRLNTQIKTTENVLRYLEKEDYTIIGENNQ